MAIVVDGLETAVGDGSIGGCWSLEPLETVLVAGWLLGGSMEQLDGSLPVGPIDQ